jgi:hypothetical protein
LGIQVTRTTHGLHLRQSKYILDVLHRARMVGAKPYSAPCVSGGKLSSQSGDPLSDISEYRSVVGALQYCTLTRPEIAYSVNQLCQHLHTPTTAHWSSAKRVLCYLKGTVDHGLYLPVALLIFMPTVIRIGLVIRMIVVPPRDMVFFWVLVLYLGVQKNSPLSPVVTLKLNIGPLP